MSASDDNFGKPEGARAGWQVRESAYAFEDPHLRLRHDRIALPSRNEMTFAYAERPLGVILVPVTDDGQVF